MAIPELNADSARPPAPDVFNNLEAKRDLCQKGPLVSVGGEKSRNEEGQHLFVQKLDFLSPSISFFCPVCFYSEVGLSGGGGDRTLPPPQGTALSALISGCWQNNTFLCPHQGGPFL